jgi:hypothetical protein
MFLKSKNFIYSLFLFILNKNIDNNLDFMKLVINFKIKN